MWSTETILTEWPGCVVCFVPWPGVALDSRRRKSTAECWVLLTYRSSVSLAAYRLFGLRHRPRKHGVRGVNWPPTFSSAGSSNVVWPPTFFMHKSMAGSLFTEARSVTLVVLCEKTHNRRRFRFAWLYDKTGDMTGIQFLRSIPFGLLTH